jgi:hypothetical protein
LANQANFARRSSLPAASSGNDWKRAGMPACRPNVAAISDPVNSSAVIRNSARPDRLSRDELSFIPDELFRLVLRESLPAVFGKGQPAPTGRRDGKELR